VGDYLASHYCLPASRCVLAVFRCAVPPRPLLGARCGDGSSTSSVTPRSLASFSRTAPLIHAPRGWSPDICPMRSSTRGDSLTPTGGATLSSAAGLPSPRASPAAGPRVSRPPAWAAEHGGHLQPRA